MRYKRFFLSFAATALLAAPFALNADSPPEPDNVLVAPAPGYTAVVDGLSFTSTVVKHDGKRALIQIKAKNDTGERISTEVVASLMQDAWASPMARMVPPPRELSADTIELGLDPGETFAKTLSVKLPADVVELLKAAPAQPVTVQAQAPNAAPNAAPAIDAAVLDLTPPAPTFFASVRAVPPAPIAQAVSQAAAK